MILAPFLTSLCAPAIVPDRDPRGHYVEARTASVFAGACHFGGERTTDGREALLAWTFDAGTFRGVDLAGATLAVAIADDLNLVDSPSARRSVVYVSVSESVERRAALVAWLDACHSELTGYVRAIRPVELALRIDDTAFELTAPGVFALVGDALPDRVCCKMPYQVWYSPLVALEDQLVGRDAEFAFEDPALGCVWSRPGENAAFFGRFGASDRSTAR